jgi:hypothetical protein
VVLGKFEIGLKDGNAVPLDFTARFRIASGPGDEAKLEHVQVWTDPTEMQAAFEKATQTLAGKE